MVFHNVLDYVFATWSHDTAGLLDELVASSEEKKAAVGQLRRIISHKTSVSYSGEVYDRKDVEQLSKQLQRFRAWALRVLQ